MAIQTGTGWRIQGTLLQVCNCDYGCPCNFNAPPTQGGCEGGWSAYIEAGHYGDTRLDGLNFAVLADWPEAIHKGNGEAVLLIDERANQTQREALVSVASGKVGGPWAILATTITKLHGPQFVPFQVTVDGARSTLRAGTVVELEMEPIRNPVTGAETYPGVVLPEGLLYKQSTRASSRSFRVRGELNYESSGKDAAFSPFEWSGP